MAEPILIGEVMVALSVSIGIVLFGDEEFDGEALVAAADAAMYRAKAIGSSRHQFAE